MACVVTVKVVSPQWPRQRGTGGMRVLGARGAQVNIGNTTSAHTTQTTDRGSFRGAPGRGGIRVRVDRVVGTGGIGVRVDRVVALE